MMLLCVAQKSKALGAEGSSSDGDWLHVRNASCVVPAKSSHLAIQHPSIANNDRFFFLHLGLANCPPWVVMTVDPAPGDTTDDAEIIAISDDDDEIAILGSTRARSSSPVFIHASHTTTHVQLQAAPSGLFESPSSPVFVRASVSASISYVDVGNSDTEDDDSDEDDFAKVMAASIAQFERETQGVGIGSGSGVGSSLRIAEPVSRKGKGRAVECAASRGVSLVSAAVLLSANGRRRAIRRMIFWTRRLTRFSHRGCRLRVVLVRQRLGQISAKLLRLP